MSEDRDIPENVRKMIERGIREMEKGNVSGPIDMEEDFPGLFEDDEENVNKDES